MPVINAFKIPPPDWAVDAVPGQGISPQERGQGGKSGGESPLVEAGLAAMLYRQGCCDPRRWAASNMHGNPQDWQRGHPDSVAMASDEALLAAWRQDPEGSWGRRAASRLLGRYQDRVYIWCWRHVRERELALDLAQEVLVSAYRNLGSFGERAQFGSWLFAIARNRCLSELRKNRPPREDAEILQLMADDRPTPDRDLEERLDESALLDLIRDHLTRQEQDALWLRCVERLPVDEITRLLDIREQSGARAVLQRARRRLRAAIDRRDAGQMEGS
jgi:RNA polymerase sigma-70 factor (ECF subfamily)